MNFKFEDQELRITHHSFENGLGLSFAGRVDDAGAVHEEYTFHECDVLPNLQERT